MFATENLSRGANSTDHDEGVKHLVAINSLYFLHRQPRQYSCFFAGVSYSILSKDSHPLVASCQPASSNTREYFRRSVTSPVLDELVTHLETRFSKQHMFAKRVLSAVPAVFLKDPAGSKACLGGGGGFRLKPHIEVRFK